MKDYDARVNEKMQDIARIVYKLEDTLNEYQDADGRLKSFFEQKKALMEIRRILHKSDDIQQLRNNEVEDQITEIDETEVPASFQDDIALTEEKLSVSPEDKRLDAINLVMTDLDETLETETEHGQNSNFAKQCAAITKMKKILADSNIHYDPQQDKLTPAEEAILQSTTIDSTFY